MLFTIRFTDNPMAFNVRKQYLDLHLEWIKQRRKIIKAAGSLREKNKDQPVGALWLVEAESEGAWPLRICLQTESDNFFVATSLRTAPESLPLSLIMSFLS